MAADHDRIVDGLVDALGLDRHRERRRIVEVALEGHERDAIGLAQRPGGHGVSIGVDQPELVERSGGRSARSSAMNIACSPHSITQPEPAFPDAA